MILCRTATLQELSQVLDWAAEEGWNPGLDDAEAFFRADPDGFFVAVDRSDHPLAAISVVNHSDSFAFLGLYIVRPAHRGKGIGLHLWQHAMRHAGDRIVGLDGVEAQQQNYVASGFAHAGGTTRYSGSVPGVVDPDIQITLADDIPALIAEEAEASGMAKPAYLQSWFNHTDYRTTYACKESERLRGFVTVRVCRLGAKIGPLLAENSDIARRLITHASALTKGIVTLDVPDTATSLRTICEGMKLEAGFKTARMYRGSFVMPRHLNFAVASLELG